MTDQTTPPAHSHGRGLIEARYRDPDLADRLSGAGWNDTLDVLFAHRSVRHYLDRPLPPGMIELIVGAAQSAPTTSNLQAWSVIAVRDTARKARLADMSARQRHIHEAPVLLVFVADLARLRGLTRETELDGAGLDYLESFVVAVADASFAAQNATVAAESLGLGCCYIGSMRNHPETVASELGLPDETVALFGMTVGFPDPAFASDIKPRLPQDVILHEEQYTPPCADSISRYNGKMRAFQAEQDMPVRDWSRLMAQRIGDRDALKGRHVLKDFLHAHGFGLK